MLVSGYLSFIHEASHDDMQPGSSNSDGAVHGGIS